MKTVSTRSLRLVAFFEAGKGALVLLVGCGALSLLGRDLEMTAEKLIRWSHLNPAAHYPQIFIKAASELTDAHLWALAAGAAAYATIRFFEAFGLWRDRTWASWLGALSGAIYLPVEVVELTKKVTGLRVGVLLINVAIVAILTLHLWQRRRQVP